MRRRLLVPTVFTIVSLAILLGLGTWQWHRMGEKEALISKITSRLAMQPQAYPAPGATVDAASLEYAPVSMSGTFLPEHEAHVFFSLAKTIGGQTGPGYLILTPFRMADGRIILVNRGFVPQHLKPVAARPGSKAVGSATITGLLRLPERRGVFSGADDPVKNIYFVRDPASIARGLGMTQVEPFTVDLKSPAPPGGLPVPNVTQIDIPNNHFQYALTWWSLAAVLAVIFLLFARQNQRLSGSPR